MSYTATRPILVADLHSPNHHAVGLLVALGVFLILRFTVTCTE